jgi:hypothetical protein
MFRRSLRKFRLRTLSLYPTSTHASILGRSPSPPGHMHDRTFIMELLTTSLAVQVKFSEVHLLKGLSESNRGVRESGCQKRPGLRGLSQSEGSLSTQHCAERLREVRKLLACRRTCLLMGVPAVISLHASIGVLPKSNCDWVAECCTSWRHCL